MENSYTAKIKPQVLQTAIPLRKTSLLLWSAQHIAYDPGYHAKKFGYRHCRKIEHFARVWCVASCKNG